MKLFVYPFTLALMMSGVIYSQSPEVEAEAEAQVETDVESSTPSDEVEDTGEAIEDAAQETEQAIETAAEETQQAAENTAEQAEQAAEDVAEETDDAIDEAAEETNEAVEQTADEIDATTEQATQEAQRLQNETSEAVDEAADAVERSANEVENDVEQAADDPIPSSPADAALESDETFESESDANTQLNQTRGINAGGNVNQLGLYLDDSNPNSLVIGQVAPNSPAARIGLRPGDRIVRFNNRQYLNHTDFRNDLRNWTQRGPVPITYWRDGRHYDATFKTTDWGTGTRSYDAGAAGQWNENDGNSYSEGPQPYTTNRPIYQEGDVPPVPATSPVPSTQAYGSTYYNPCCDPCANGYNNVNSRRAERIARRNARRAQRHGYGW